jgi:hypothetical protein
VEGDGDDGEEWAGEKGFLGEGFGGMVGGYERNGGWRWVGRSINRTATYNHGSLVVSVEIKSHRSGVGEILHVRQD